MMKGIEGYHITTLIDLFINVVIHVANTNGAVNATRLKDKNPYRIPTDKAIEMNAKTNEVHFLSENAIPHNTALKPKMPRLIRFSQEGKIKRPINNPIVEPANA